MMIVWDEAEAVEESHDARARLRFARYRLLRGRDRGSGQARSQHGNGELGDGVIATIFLALDGEGISVISMRPASRKERKTYERFKEVRAPHG
jgi:uncharacterized protein